MLVHDSRELLIQLYCHWRHASKNQLGLKKDKMDSDNSLCSLLLTQSTFQKFIADKTKQTLHNWIHTAEHIFKI